LCRLTEKIRFIVFKFWPIFAFRQLRRADQRSLAAEKARFRQLTRNFQRQLAAENCFLQENHQSRPDHGFFDQIGRGTSKISLIIFVPSNQSEESGENKVEMIF